MLSLSRDLIPDTTLLFRGDMKQVRSYQDRIEIDPQPHLHPDGYWVWKETLVWYGDVSQLLASKFHSKYYHARRIDGVWYWVPDGYGV